MAFKGIRSHQLTVYFSERCEAVVVGVWVSWLGIESGRASYNGANGATVAGGELCVVSNSYIGHSSSTHRALGVNWIRKTSLAKVIQAQAYFSCSP